MGSPLLDNRRVQWLWGKLSAVLVLVGIYLANDTPAAYEGVVTDVAAGVCLLLGLIGLVTYTRRYGLPPSSPAAE